MARRMSSERKKSRTKSRAGESPKLDYYKILIPAILILGILIRIFAFITIPKGLGFDENSHYAYARFIAENWSFPNASEGTTFYQPPLFHILGAFTYSLAGVLGIADAFFIIRFVSTFFGILTIPIVYLAAREVFPENRRIQILSLAIASFLPIHSLTSGMIGNDAVTSFFVSLTVYLLLKYESEPTLRKVALIGVAAAFSALSRYNGLVVLPVVGIYYILKRRWEHLAIVSLLILTLSGWWYLRNYMNYGALAPYAWDVFGGQTSKNLLANILGLYHAASYNFPLIQKLMLKLLNYFYITLWHWHTYYFAYDFPLPLSGYLSGYIKALLTLCIIAGLFYMAANFRRSPKLMVMFLLSIFLLISLINYLLAVLALLNYSVKYTDYHVVATARYILPMIVPLSIFTSVIIDKFLNKKGIMIAGLFLFISAVYSPPSYCDIFPEPVAQPITYSIDIIYIISSPSPIPILPYPWGIYWVGVERHLIEYNSSLHYVHLVYDEEGALVAAISDRIFLKFKWRECSK